MSSEKVSTSTSVPLFTNDSKLRIHALLGEGNNRGVVLSTSRAFVGKLVREVAELVGYITLCVKRSPGVTKGWGSSAWLTVGTKTLALPSSWLGLNLIGIVLSRLPRQRRTAREVGVARPRVPASSLLQSLPHPHRGGRHVYVGDALMRERIYDRVDDRGGCGYGPRLSDALHAHRVGRRGGHCPVEDHVRYLRGAGDQVVHHCAGHQVAVLIVDSLLVKGLPYPLCYAAMQLAVHDGRVDHRPAVIHRHVLGDRNHPGLRVHLDNADVRPVRPREVRSVEDMVSFEQWFHAFGEV